MHNCVVLIGRITDEPTILNGETGNYMNINLAVQREYKDENGKYDTDFIRCKLWNNIADNVSEYCKKGDLVSVKGRLQNYSIQKDDGENKYITEVVVERICFLASSKKSVESKE